MSDPLNTLLKGESNALEGSLDTPNSDAISNAPSDIIEEAGDEILTDIFKEMNLRRLDGFMDNRIPILPRTGDESRAETTVHGDSRAESKICNSQITTGGDMNLHSLAYHVTGNFIQVNHRYEASGTPTSRDSYKEASESKKTYAEDTDEIAANMLVPAPPLCILERDAQHSQIVTKLTSVPNARVAILGMGGIGKTTLACSVANDSEIVEAYPRRLFLSFEGCSTPDLAYTNLATTFQIPPDRRSSHRQILAQVLNYLAQLRTLLVIDNFESFWEVPSNRRAAEDLLGQLAAIQQLAMVVTLRGIQRPGNIGWLKVEPLQTLSHDASKELLSAIVDEEYTEVDLDHIQKLLDAVAGIPLAVTLIGSLLRDASETPKSLWYQWTQESSRAIRINNEMESDDRLYKLDISLRLSVFSPRMSDNAKEVLAAISILPTGLSMDETWIDDLQHLLPSTIRIRDCIRTLRNVALVTLDTTTSPHRLRLLPPVRDFCLNNLPLNCDPACRMIDMYTTNLLKHWDWGSKEHYTWVAIELTNITATLNHAIALGYVTDRFGDAVFRYAEWRRFLCMPETTTIERAIEVLSDYPTAKANCLQALGRTLNHLNCKREAIQPLENALYIRREIGDKFELARVLSLIGDTHLRLHDYSNAERHLNEARALLREIDDDELAWEKGSVWRKLADIYLAQNKLLEAECTAKEALELCCASSNRRGEINSLRVLGIVYRKQRKYNLAIERLTAARDASQATNDTHGEALANASLGHLYCDANRPDQAARYFRLAIPLFERGQRLKAAENARSTLKRLEAFLGVPQA